LEAVSSTEWDPDKLAETARRARDAFEKSFRVILCVGLPRVEAAQIARRLCVDLVQLAAEVLRNSVVDKVFAEGGSTAYALAQEMGWSRLSVSEQLSPGVAELRLESKSPALLIIKPGSYLWPPKVQALG
jgi:uncharacterized protein YgbK (DUF1537 family)